MNLRLRFGLAAESSAVNTPRKIFLDEGELLIIPSQNAKGAKTVMDKLAEESLVPGPGFHYSLGKEWTSAIFWRTPFLDLAWLKSRFQNLLRNFQK